MLSIIHHWHLLGWWGHFLLNVHVFALVCDRHDFSKSKISQFSNFSSHTVFLSGVSSLMGNITEKTNLITKKLYDYVTLWYQSDYRGTSSHGMDDTCFTNWFLAFICKYHFNLGQKHFHLQPILAPTNQSLKSLSIFCLYNEVSRNVPFKYLYTQHNSTGISILQKPIFLHQLLSTSNSVA